MNRRQVVLGAGGAAAAAGIGGYLMGRGPSYAEAVAQARAGLLAQGDGDMRRLVGHAVLAANSHNTQAWRFRTSARLIEIVADRARATPVVDPDDHHLFASLGCACENLVLAAADAGLQAQVTFAPEIAGLRIGLETARPASDALFAAIGDRQCTRAEFDGRAVAAADLAVLERAAGVAGCRVVLVTDRAAMEAVLELIVAASRVQTEDRHFMRELNSWIRFNAASAVATGDGLFAGCSGNPSLPSWLGNLLFDHVVTAKGEAAKCVSQVRSSAGLAVFVSDENDPLHWVQAGRSYQRFALQATVLGMKHAFLNQPVEVARFRPALAKLLGIGDRRPDLVVRFGYGLEMPRSMRRPLSDVMAAL